jgi:hypothetical protein
VRAPESIPQALIYLYAADTLRPDSWGSRPHECSGSGTNAIPLGDPRICVVVMTSHPPGACARQTSPLNPARHDIRSHFRSMVASEAGTLTYDSRLVNPLASLSVQPNRAPARRA